MKKYIFAVVLNRYLLLNVSYLFYRTTIYEWYVCIQIIYYKVSSYLISVNSTYSYRNSNVHTLKTLEQRNKSCSKFKYFCCPLCFYETLS